ncbi:MAG: alanine dehydrogenase [Cellvibrionaceae bacterium]|jgi:alanine dehydrogenase
MKIGIPKEVKNHEYRVSMIPASVAELTRRLHTAVVETNAGKGIGFSDADYVKAGAIVVDSAEEVFSEAEMIVKVKEPQAQERAMLKPNQLLFTYLHLAPDAAQTKDLVDSGAIAIAYETITSDSGQLPLLAPMSEVAGRMSVQAGAHCLEKAQGGSGMLLAGVPGVAPAKVLIIGGGVVGANAAQMAIGLGARVTILDNNIDSLRRLDRQFGSAVELVYSTIDALTGNLVHSDLVIGAVLIPGAAAPKLVTAKMLKKMKPGSVLVDVAIDQGGCFETSRATTHQDPTYIVDDIVHYCVANMPGGVARTASFALNNATLPYVIRLADKWSDALSTDKHFLNGLNVCRGRVTNFAVAEALGYPYAEPRGMLS